MLIFLIAFGAAFFIGGLCLFLKKQDDVKSLRVFGLTSYIGLGMLTLGVTLALEPVLSQLPPTSVYFLDFAVFAAGAFCLVRPGFTREKRR